MQLIVLILHGHEGVHHNGEEEVEEGEENNPGVWDSGLGLAQGFQFGVSVQMLLVGIS